MSILTEKPEYFTPGDTEERVRLVPISEAERAKIKAEFAAMAAKMQLETIRAERLDTFLGAAKQLQQGNGMGFTQLVNVLARASKINMTEWLGSEVTRRMEESDAYDY